MQPMIIPSTRMYDRIDQITEYLERFPEGPAADALRKEIAYLEAVRDCRLEDARRLREAL